jgi:hypothetical protein
MFPSSRHRLRWPVLAIGLAVGGLLGAVALMGGASGRDGDGLLEEERTAVRWLQTIADAQQRIQADGTLDTDGDGIGEHAFLGELGGGSRLRIDADGAVSYQTIETPLLPLAFARVQNRCVTIGGYHFQVLLPATGADGAPGWVEENEDGGGAGIVVNVDDAERRFCAFAWPAATSPATHTLFLDPARGVWCAPRADGTAAHRGGERRPAVTGSLPVLGEPGLEWRQLR